MLGYWATQSDFTNQQVYGTLVQLVFSIDSAASAIRQLLLQFKWTVIGTMRASTADGCDSFMQSFYSALAYTNITITARLYLDQNNDGIIDPSIASQISSSARSELFDCLFVFILVDNSNEDCASFIIVLHTIRFFSVYVTCFGTQPAQYRPYFLQLHDLNLTSSSYLYIMQWNTKYFTSSKPIWANPTVDDGQDAGELLFGVLLIVIFCNFTDYSSRS